MRYRILLRLQISVTMDVRAALEALHLGHCRPRNSRSACSQSSRSCPCIQAPALLEDLVRSPRNFILNRARPRLEVHNQAFQLSRSLVRRVPIRQVRRRGLPDVLPIAIDSDEPTNRQGGYQMSNVEAIVRHPGQSQAPPGHLTPYSIVDARHLT